MTSSSHSKQPARSNGWLKVALAGSGIALTVLGTGLIAREAAGQTQTNVRTDSALQAIPTVMPVPSRSRSNRSSRGSRQQLQAPGQSSQGLQMPGGFTQSRSSR